MSQFLKNLVHDDSGQDLVEYALVTMLIGMTLFSAMRVLGTTLSGVFNSIGNSLTSATA